MRGKERPGSIACRPGRPAILVGLAAGCGGARNSALPASESAIRFEDRAAEAGIAFHMNFLPGEQGADFKINFYDHGSGVCAADVDGDGDDDLYFVNQLGSNALYRNNGDGTFTDITASSGPIGLGDRICVSAVLNDFDNDGDQDLFVVSTRGGNVFFRNDGRGHFVDETEKAGVAHVGHTQGTTAFDADGDGLLDLFITNTASWTTDHFDTVNRYYAGGPGLTSLIESPVELNLFYHNNGDGTFTEATDAAGVRGLGWGGDTAVFDYDEDGDLDLFVGNMFGTSILYRNDGKGHFEDVTRDVLGKTPFGTVGVRAFDYDADGHLDFYAVDMHSDMWTTFDYGPERIDEKKKYPWIFGKRLEDGEVPRQFEDTFASRLRLKYSTVFFGNGLYRNLGNGRFEERSDEANAETWWPWGIGAGDFDNDGFEDVYLASGMGYPYFFMRSPLLVNRGDGTFEEQFAAAGVDPPPGGPNLPDRILGKDASKSSRSVAVADLDHDGRLDLIVNNFNDHPYLYLNRSRAGNHIAFRLTGRKSNRDAIGALVRIEAGDRKLVRMVQAAGGYLAQSSKEVHFGLGTATRIDRCEIRWPDGTVQSISSPEINRLHAIAED